MQPQPREQRGRRGAAARPGACAAALLALLLSAAAPASAQFGGDLPPVLTSNMCSL
jgi:hypothetical protein